MNKTREERILELYERIKGDKESKKTFNPTAKCSFDKPITVEDLLTHLILETQDLNENIKKSIK